MPFDAGVNAPFPRTAALCVGESENPIPSRDKTGMVVLRCWHGVVPYEFHTNSIQVPYTFHTNAVIPHL